MKIATKMAAQGDGLFRRVTKIPASFVEQPRNGPIVACHSETGHHHTIDDVGVAMFADPANPFVCYLRLSPGVDADVVHQRAWDTHETLRLLGEPKAPAVWQVRRQREWSPEGWRAMAD